MLTITLIRSQCIPNTFVEPHNMLAFIHWTGLNTLLPQYLPAYSCTVLVAYYCCCYYLSFSSSSSYYSTTTTTTLPPLLLILLLYHHHYYYYFSSSSSYYYYHHHCCCCCCLLEAGKDETVTLKLIVKNEDMKTDWI